MNVRAPSDLAADENARDVRVAGRVVLVADRKLELADAFGSIRVELAQTAELAVGDLIVVSGEQRGRTLSSAALVERHRHPPPPGGGELSRLLFQGVGPRLALRARALAEIRSYFNELNFIEIDSPLRVPTPGLDLHVDAIASDGGYLMTSPEHALKRLLAGGMPRIYQLSHVCRAGELGPWHEPEFCLLEWYRAFSDAESVMADTEQIVCRVLGALGSELEASPPFERITVREAFQRFAGIADAAELAERDEDRYFELFVAKVEPAIAALGRPIFLCDYPISQASLARAKPTDPSVAERFELYLSGIELCNGFGELTDPAEQRRRFERDQEKRRELGRPVYPIDERLLAALEEGMPPSGGNALGVDRLIALAMGQKDIQSVLPLPASRMG